MLFRSSLNTSSNVYILVSHYFLPQLSDQILTLAFNNHNRKPIEDLKLRAISCSVLEPANKKKRGSALHCCVPQCNNDSRYNSSLSFHRFPKKDEQLRARWVVKIGRDIGESFQVHTNYN